MVDRIITARVTTALGKTNTDQITVTIQEAAFTAPSLAFTAPANNATVTGNFTVSGTFTKDSRLSVSFIRAKIGTGSFSTMTRNDSTGTWTGTLGSAGTGEGASTIIAEIQDSAGQLRQFSRNVNTDNTPEPSNEVVFTAVGDCVNNGSGTSQSQDQRGLRTSSLIINWGSEVKFHLPLGDLLYDWVCNADTTTWNQTYGRSQLRPRHRPAPGNHEDCLSAYYSYYTDIKNLFGNGGQYYAFDLGNGWRLYSINNYIPEGVGSAQYNWLQADLQQNSGKRIIAYWHEPAWPHCSDKSPYADIRPMFSLLRAARCDLVLTGHAHAYYRYPRMNATGDLDSLSPYQITCGMGGAGQDSIPGSCSSSDLGGSSSMLGWPNTQAFFRDHGPLKVRTNSNGQFKVEYYDAQSNQTTGQLRDSLTAQSLK
jgi:hypothetical protein